MVGGSRWARSWVAWRGWGVAAAIAATATFLIDRLRITTVAANANGLSMTQEWTLWSGHAVLALLVVAVGTLAWLARLIVPARRRDSWLGRVVAPSLVALAFVLAPLHWVGEQLASGAWISDQWFAPLVVLGPPSVGLVSVPIAIGIAFSSAPPSRRHSFLTAALVGLLLVLAVADHWVGAGIHPSFQATGAMPG